MKLLSTLSPCWPRTTFAIVLLCLFLPFGAPTTVVDLGRSIEYAILAKTGISTVPASAITGNIGVSPAAATLMTGFELVADWTNVFSTSTQVTGRCYASNYAVPSPSDLTTQVSNMETAYTDAAGRADSRGAENNGGAMGGTTFLPGVYSWTTIINIASAISFDGQGNSGSVFILKTTKGITMSANIGTTLSNGASAANIFWQVAENVVIGAGGHMEGILLAKAQVKFETGSSLNGRILSQADVILQKATITAPTTVPTKRPTGVPTKQPTKQPAKSPTQQPTITYQGSGVVNAGPLQNYMNFFFTSTISFGDKIGFYFFDKTVASSSISDLNEYDCGLISSNLKAPLLSISPSTEFNDTTPLPYHNISVSPSRTPFFGGLGQGRYKLCYCKKPTVSATNPLGECRPVDYKNSAGVFFFYDAPELKQKRSVNSDKNFNRFLFKIKKLNSNGINQRIVIPDLPSAVQTGFAMTTGCGSSQRFSSGSQPAWSNGGVSADETTQKTPLTLVRSTHSFDEVAFQLPSQTVTSPTPEGFYSVCLCDSENIGTGNFNDCDDTFMCETRACTVPHSAPVEIAAVFVHNLGFFTNSHKTVFAMNVANKTAATPVSFVYSKPAATWALSKSFWFALSNMSCGAGAQTSADAYMTLPLPWPSSTSSTSVSFATLASTSVLIPYRLCVQQQDGSVLDIDNVVVVINDVKVTFSGSMSDKISDNNQVGLRPSQITGITGTQYQKTVNAVAQDHGVWFSENFVDLKLDWTSSIAAYNEIYAVLSTFPCSISASYTVAGNGSARSKSHSIAQNLVSASFPLDLGTSLYNSTVINPSSSTYSINTSFVAPAPTSQNQNTLFADYSLCATCKGCSGFGYELGTRFRVLAALHVYQDIGFEKPYRFNLVQQNIVIASAAVPTSSFSSSLLFLTSDQLYFVDSSNPCFNWNIVGYNTNSSAPVYGNQTVYTSTTAGTRASLLNAFQYSFDFSSIPVEKADGRLFRLCVLRVNEVSVMDFPGCAVSIIQATQSPSAATSQTASYDSRTYAASPDGSMQRFTLKSVVYDNVYNLIQWKFKGGPVDAADRLSVSAVGDGANTATECLAQTYSFTTVLANGNGGTSVSPATSSAISGMLPGQYALCYCNVKVTGANIVACRTARDFRQFVGYVYFDGSYQGTEYVRSFAVAYNTEQNIKLKMVSASQNDRLMLITSSGTCGSDYALDTALSSLPMSNPAVTKAPTSKTSAPAAPTKGPTKAPITTAPTAKPTALPTKAPSKSPTISPTSIIGRRRRLLVAPTHAPITRAPTRAPITTAPSTKAPTKAPITTAPTSAPITTAPTKKPTLNPLAALNHGATAYTKSPTNAGATLPYVEMGLATARKFMIVGQFKLCYCWHNRYSSVGATSSSSTQTISVSYPTAAPITSAPTTAGRRRRLASANTFTQHNYANTTGTSCLLDSSTSQYRFGAEIGMLIVHDVYMVSGTSSSAQPTITHRMAVRSINNQIVTFYHQQSAVFYQNGATGWFQSVGVTCSNCGISGTSTGCANSLGLKDQSLIVGTFDFSSGFARDCSSGRRKNDYATVEEAFFYRLCQQQGAVKFDFSNIMVTVTDIKILDGYQNPLLATSTGDVPVKFNEACGFLWNERDWRKPTYFRFVADDKVCSFGATNTASGATPVDYNNELASSTGHHFVEYFMYEGSLIKYFLDDSDYSSVVKFTGTPRYRVPYRMCMYIQSALGWSTTGSTLDWVDFPDVTLSIVSARVKMSTKQNEYASTTQTNCPLGFLGCKCFTDNTCSTTHMYRDLDAPFVGLAATCAAGLNLCVAPVRSLSGTRETYTSSSVSAPWNVTCTSVNPCHNPGPYPNVQAYVYLTFSSNDLKVNDKIRFVKGTDPCTCTGTNSCSSASELVTNLQTTSIVTVDSRFLFANEYHRLCVYTAYSTLDYYSTGFVKDQSTTLTPTTYTLKPTTWYNKGQTATFSPTLVNPEFFSNQRYPEPHDNLMAAKFNMLHIVQSDSNNPPLFAQWTNFTIEKVLAQDTLRVYRMVESRSTHSGLMPTDTICTPSWARTQTLEQNDMVMELRVNKDQTDTTTTSGAVSTVQFPPLAKGYYTVCFCRKTTSGRCQMTSAGMIYSSAAKHVSVTGVGKINTSFRVTPLLEYEISPSLFNVTRSQYITADHFCLSNATSGCSSCRYQGSTAMRNMGGTQEFSFALTTGSFPLVITNLVEHATGTTDKVYNLCFQDPMLMQFRTTTLNSTHLVSTRFDVNNTWFHDTWNYAQIGTVYFSDLTFQWEQDGGFTAARSSYSVAVGTNTMARLQYTGSNEVIQFNDYYWFTAANYPCSTVDSTIGVSTAQQLVTAKGFNTYLRFSSLTAGMFYRLCVRSAADTSMLRDFGVDFGVWVTDVKPSANTFHFFKSFHLSLTSSLSLRKGDEFFLLHVAKTECRDYSTLTAGWVSPNMGVYNQSLYHNMGKMPQLTLAGVYSNVPLGFAGYRLCVKRTDGFESTYLDYAGLLFNPQGSNHVVQNIVAKAANIKVRILSGLTRDFSATLGSDTVFASFTVQPTDVVWFRRSDVPCAKDVWNSAANSLVIDAPGGAKLSSSRFTVADTHYDQSYGQYLELNFDFGLTDVSAFPFRMCVERLSWVNDPSNTVYTYAPKIVQEYADVFVTVTDSAVSSTSSPTAFQQLRIKPTTALGTTPASNQVVTVYSSKANNQFTWFFTGTVDPANDKLAIVAVRSNSAQNCSGQIEFAEPLFLIAASNDTTAVGPSTTSPKFGAVASGKYFICYCQASASITGDCSNELGWRQTVGFLYSFAVTPTDLSVSKFSTSQTPLTVWFNQVVDSTMKFIIIDKNGSCGNTAALSDAVVPNLQFTQPSTQIETGSPLATGLTFSATYSSAVIGVYQLCFCPQFCAYNVTSFGGKVSDLLIHDILINGQKSAVSLQKLTTTTAVVKLTFNQSLFTAGTDQLWFARNDCGLGNHTPTENLTAVTVVPVSGNSFTLNYSLAVPSMAIHKLCMKNVTSSKVYSFSSLGFIATDINLTVTSPVISATAAIGVSYVSGLEVLNTNPSVRVLFFRAISQTCSGACDTASQTCTIVSDQHTTNSQQVTYSFHTSNQHLQFDLSRLTTLTAYRLCVLMDRSANNPKTFIDFNNVRIYPVPSDTVFYVTNGAALHEDNYAIFLTTPVSGAGTPRSIDVLYFRRFDLPCMQTAPAAADVNTSSAFSFKGNMAVGAPVNFGAVNMTQIVFRMCVVTSSGDVLDYNTKTLYMTTVVVSTKLCRPSTSACRVSLSVTNPEGLFSSNNVVLWFQRETFAVRACTTIAPSVSSADSSRIASYGTLSSTGTIDFDFSSVSGSLSVPLKLCVFNGNTRVTGDFPTVNLFALDIRLAPASSVNTAPATLYVTRSNATVRIMASASSVPTGSKTWFQLSSTACVQSSVATANQTSITTTTSSLEAGVDLTYDFSGVLLNSQKRKAFRLCFTSFNSAVIDANTVEVIVVEYTVTPAFVGRTTLERILVDPSKDVDLSYYAFCKIDTPCPTFSQLKEVSTVNCSSRGISLLPSASSELDFSNVVSEGKLLKLCGVRVGATSPYDVRDLQPKGVFQGSLAINLNVALATSTNTAVVTTWAGVLGNATTGDKIWFQARDVLCSSTSQADNTSATGTADVKASPFTSVFDFSKITSTPYLKLCASINGTIKDFTEITISLMNVSLGATSVKIAAEQNFTINYTSTPALGGVVRAFFSSDVTCASGAAPMATPSVASTSGAVHSMNFSAVAASATPYYLCLAGNITLGLDFAKLYVTDVAYLGKISVTAAAAQSLTLSANVSLQTGDSVWFSASGCSATTGKSSSSSVNYTASTSAYTFDFSGTNASLTTALSMCVQRSPTMTYEYSSSSVVVLASASLGGPYLIGSRTLNLSSLSSFLGSSAVDFVANTAACSTGTYVASTTTVYSFTSSATYRLCVKQTGGSVTDVSGVSVFIQDCSQICPASRAVLSACDTTNGHCTQCTPHFTGNQCQLCAAGYSGVNCDTCNTVANYNCASGATVSGFCALTDTCTVCGCNGHFDPAATFRCPMNVCVCAAGYAGADCGSCSVGYYQTVTNSSSLTCNSCADKCNKHASSCTADVCQCSDNYDSVSSCRYCKAGFVHNTTTGVCVHTTSPTRVPSRSPSVSPSVSPTAAPTVNPCAGATDSKTYTSCADWGNQNLCTDATWMSFMKVNCKKTCCNLKQAAKAPTPTAGLAYCLASDSAAFKNNCSGWAASAAGYCADPQYSSFMGSNCGFSCRQKNNAAYSAQCSGWALQGLCSASSIYANFMQDNCPASCCSPYVSLVKTDNQTYSGLCSTWATGGYCTDTTYGDFMLSQCGESCSNYLAGSVCKADLEGNCGNWLKFCLDPVYKGFMQQNCARSCGSPLPASDACSDCASLANVTSCPSTCCKGL